MATKNVTTRIQLWNKTTSGWESKNPVLLRGEFGFDSDKKYIKMGDGVTAWNALPSIRLPKESIDGFVDENTKYDIREDVAGKKFTLLSSDGVNRWGDVRSFTCHDWSSDIVDAEAEAIATAEADAETKALSAISVSKTYTDELADQVSVQLFDLDTRISAVEEDYLKCEDKTELEALIANETSRALDKEDELNDRVDGEVARAALAESLLDTRISAIEDDYLKAADKTELAGSIAAEAARAATEESALDGRLDTIEADYLKTVDKTALETSIASKVSQSDYNTKIGEIETSIGNKADKATTLAGYGINNAFTQDETVTEIGDAIKELDVTVTGMGAGKTVASLTEADGKIAATFQNIAIAESQVTDLMTDLGNKVNVSDYNTKMAALDTEIGKKAAQTDLTAAEGKITAIEGKIPSEASDTNKLADKSFVNSSIATATAAFQGTYGTIEEIEALSADANDYAFLSSVDAAGNTKFDRYKFSVALSGWVYEYTLNNSSFTAAQWGAINSGAATTNIAQIDTNKTAIATLTGDVDALETTVSNLSGTVADTYLSATTFETWKTGDYATRQTTIDTEIGKKATSATTLAGYGITDAYTKTETDDISAFLGSEIVTRAELTSVYTKTEIDTALGNKADKATTLAGYGIADAYTQTQVNTISANIEGSITTKITNAINDLDVAAITGATSKTITSISETNGKIAATYSNIAITESQVTGLTTALAGKADKATTLAGYNIGNAYTASETNEAIATTVTNAINALDVAAMTGSAAKTVTSVSETDGKVSVTYSDITIAESQVTNLNTHLNAKLATTTYNTRITNLNNALSAITADEDADIITINNALRMLKAALS